MNSSSENQGPKSQRTSLAVIGSELDMYSQYRKGSEIGSD